MDVDNALQLYRSYLAFVTYHPLSMGYITVIYNDSFMNQLTTAL